MWKLPPELPLIKPGKKYLPFNLLWKMVQDLPLRYTGKKFLSSNLT